MLNDIPIEIYKIIINYLDIKDIYSLLYISNDINEEYGKDKFKGEYYHKYLIKFINRDYDKFKNELYYVKNGLNELFIYSLLHIESVWLNYQQGFHNMNYIYECMLRGCRINDEIIDILNIRGKHFYTFFYGDLLRCMDKDRESTQKNIDNCKILRSLHTSFISYPKLI